MTARHVGAQGGPSSNALKQLSVEELMNLKVTSVSRHPEKLAEVASAIQVITRDDILRSGVTSLPEALRLASNLQVAQIDSRQWAITARGFNNSAVNKLLVLIDGRTVYTPLYSGVFWDVQNLPLADIERIEVISGPGATLWGANAVNGVINITTRGAHDTRGLSVQAEGGSALKGLGSIRYGTALGSTGAVRVYAEDASRDQTTLPNGNDAGDGWRMAQGGFRADWDRSGSDHLTLQGDLYNGSIAQPNAQATAISGGNVLGRWSREFSAQSNMRLQLYYDRTHREAPNAFAEGLDTYDVDFQRRFAPAASHDVVWGLGYRLIHDTVTNSAALAFLPPVVQRQWFSGFVQDEITLVPDRLRLAIGTKVEHNDYTGVEVQPSVRMNWHLEARQTLWAAVSRAVRAPSRIDREFFVPGHAPYVLNGGPDEHSETLVAYELGYRAQPTDALSLSLATFYNVYDDLRSVHVVTTTPLQVVFANGLRGVSRGAELTADLRLTDAWRLHGGYTELYVHLQPKPGSTDVELNNGEIFDPDRQLALRSSADLPGRMTFDVDYRYVGRIAKQSVPAYQEADARLAWQPVSAIELSVAGRNLLHAEHAEFGALTARREIARSVYGRVAWHY